MKETLIPITEDTKFTDAYHFTQSAIDAFSNVCPRIPSVMKKISQNIYGRFDEAAYNLYAASNEDNIEKKIEYLETAQQNLFFQYSSIESIVRGKGLTIGAANEVLRVIKIAHENTVKWLRYEKKQARALKARD